MRKFSDRDSLDSKELVNVNGGYDSIDPLAGWVKKTCTQSWCGKTKSYPPDNVPEKCIYCNFPYDDNPIKRLPPIT